MPAPAVAATLRSLFPLPLLFLAPLDAAETPLLAPASVYERVAPSVVGIAALEKRQQTGVYFGTGTIVHSSGIVITSTTVVPPGAGEIHVFLLGGDRLTARLIATEPGLELSLLRLDPGPTPRQFPAVPLGDSDALRVGEPALTLGNAFLSIQNDDQVALGEGVISGRYTVLATLSESKYMGHVLETSAHLNSGMDGGPLVDASGALVGVLCLNYSRSRWLGTAAPINDLKPLVLPHLGVFDDAAERLSRVAGLELADEGGMVRVRSAREAGPARQAGVQAGDVVLQVDGTAVPTTTIFRQAFRAAAGPILRLRVTRDGAEHVAEIRLWRAL